MTFYIAVHTDFSSVLISLFLRSLSVFPFFPLLFSLILLSFPHPSFPSLFLHISSVSFSSFLSPTSSLSLSLSSLRYLNYIYNPFLSSLSSFLFPLAVASVCFDDEACGSSSIMSEEDSETRSTCSLGSSPSSPQELLSPCPFASSSSSCMSSSNSPSPTPSSSSSSPTPPSRPCSLDLPSTVSLSDFGLISPVLGPRSECSGASSPECDLERGGWSQQTKYTKN